MVETKINGWKSREAARAQVPPMDQLFLDLTASCKKFVEFGIFTRKKLLQLRKGYFFTEFPPPKKLEGRRTTKRQVRDSWHGRPHIGANGVS